MHVKKYEAKTMKEALDMVKADLGPEAIILSAKDNSKKYGLVGEGSVEVTAAITDLSLRKKQIVENRLPDNKKDILRKSTAKNQKHIINKAIANFSKPESKIESKHELKTNVKVIGARSNASATRYADILDDEFDNDNQTGYGDDSDDFTISNLNIASDRIKNAAQRALDAVQLDNFSLFNSPKSAALKKFEIQKNNFNTTEANFNNINFTSSDQNFINNSSIDYEENVVVENQNKIMVNDGDEKEVIVSSLQKEVDELRKIIEGIKSMPQGKNQNIYPGYDYGIQYELSFIFEKLQNSGIKPEYIAEILSGIQEHLLPHQKKNKSLAEGCVVKKFLEEIKISNSAYSNKIQIFIGASGHGKTSSLIKLASHLAIRDKKKIAIATIDTYKVGATEQLKIYSQILNVPFVVIRTPQDWNSLQQEIESLDYILLDTPGFGLKNTSELVLIHRLLPPEKYSSSHHLVLSATSKDEDAFEIGKRFINIKFDDVIFTALDESSKHGVIYNFHKYYNIPLHSFGTGSNIPEDFELATSERVIDLIFKISNIGFGSNTHSA